MNIQNKNKKTCGNAYWKYSFAITLIKSAIEDLGQC